jgi:glycosyltransferase involved in cell wall biosynthesis
MTREITPLRDAHSLLLLYRFFHRARPDLVQTYSPKAGLLGMIAAWLARVPVRVHGIVGLPLMECSGPRLWLLRLIERLTYAAATQLTCNSLGLREWIYRNLSKRPIEVIGRGSINGVDTDALTPANKSERSQAREALGITDGECVFTFVGRLVCDKGVRELFQAFAVLHARHPSTKLLLVGDFDEHDPLPASVRVAIAAHPGVIQYGWVDQVRAMYAVADVVVLPSYREGMPNVILEAGSMGLPVIATDINGSNEIVISGENGLLVPAKDGQQLAKAMEALISPALRRDMGTRGRQIIERDFRQNDFCDRLSAYYSTLLASEG